MSGDEPTFATMLYFAGTRIPHIRGAEPTAELLVITLDVVSIPRPNENVFRRSRSCLRNLKESAIFFVEIAIITKFQQL